MRKTSFKEYISLSDFGGIAIMLALNILWYIQSTVVMKLPQDFVFSINPLNMVSIITWTFIGLVPVMVLITVLLIYEHRKLYLRV